METKEEKEESKSNEEESQIVPPLLVGLTNLGNLITLKAVLEKDQALQKDDEVDKLIEEKETLEAERERLLGLFAVLFVVTMIIITLLVTTGILAPVAAILATISITIVLVSVLSFSMPDKEPNKIKKLMGAYKTCRLIELESRKSALGSMVKIAEVDYFKEVENYRENLKTSLTQLIKINQLLETQTGDLADIDKKIVAKRIAACKFHIEQCEKVLGPTWIKDSNDETNALIHDNVGLYLKYIFEYRDSLEACSKNFNTETLEAYQKSLENLKSSLNVIFPKEESEIKQDIDTSNTGKQEDLILQEHSTIDAELKCLDKIKKSGYFEQEQGSIEALQKINEEMAKQLTDLQDNLQSYDNKQLIIEQLKSLKHLFATYGVHHTQIENLQALKKTLASTEEKLIAPKIESKIDAYIKEAEQLNEMVRDNYNKQMNSIIETAVNRGVGADCINNENELPNVIKSDFKQGIAVRLESKHDKMNEYSGSEDYHTESHDFKRDNDDDDEDMINLVEMEKMKEVQQNNEHNEKKDDGSKTYKN